MAAEQGSVKTGLALGLLSAIGPLAIDLYLPAFPTMVRDLHATPGEVQRTLSAFFLAPAAGPRKAAAVPAPATNTTEH